MIRYAEGLWRENYSVPTSGMKEQGQRSGNLVEAKEIPWEDESR